MGSFKIKKAGKAPHVWYPEILHWKEGDEIRSFDYGEIENNNYIQNLMLRIDGIIDKDAIPTNVYLYKGITDRGFIIIAEKDSGRLYKIQFKKFIKNAINLSLRDRSIEQDLKSSKEYMELINTFQKAYHELEESDKTKNLLK